MLEQVEIKNKLQYFKTQIRLEFGFFVCVFFTQSFFEFDCVDFEMHRDVSLFEF